MSTLSLLFAILSCATLTTSQGLGLNARVYMFFAQQNPAQPFRLAGILNIEQNPRTIRLTGTLTGFAPGQHGFHVHESGDLGNACLDAQAHYNPANVNHGGPGQIFPSTRHVGDLGNVLADGAGTIQIDETFRRVSLFGSSSIFGRGVVVHTQQDDLGVANNGGSRATGNAGGRIACGVIGRV